MSPLEPGDPLTPIGAQMPDSGPGGAFSAEIVRQLRALEPGEPSVEARDRIWQSIAARLDDPAAVPVQPATPVVALESHVAPNGVSRSAPGRGWRALLDRLAALAGPWSSPRRAPAWAMAALVILLALGAASGVAQVALPGSALYPVKQAWEAAQWNLSPTPGARARLALTLADRRRGEAEALVAQNASPQLVSSTLQASLGYLDYAAAHLPPGAASASVAAWQADTAAWPPAYRSGATAALNNWVGSHPAVQPVLTATPTQHPSVTASSPPATATPIPTGTPGHQPTATASRVASVTPSPVPTNQPTGTPTGLPNLTVTAPVTLPAQTPTAPTILGATPTELHFPGATATNVLPTPMPSYTPAVVLPTVTLPAIQPPATATLAIPPAITATPLIVLPTVTVTILTQLP